MPTVANTVCIIGAGVSGLSTAIELLDKGYDVTVIARETGDRTTSYAAAAFWYPFWTGEVDHAWYKPEWAIHTYFALADHALHQASGVSKASLVEYFPSDMSSGELSHTVDEMWWRFLPELRFRSVPKEELGAIKWSTPNDPEVTFQSGVRFETYVVNMYDYLPYLATLVTTHASGLGRIEAGKEVSLRPTDGQIALVTLLGTYDVVVNCSGTGARELVPDYRVFSKEGVVVRIPPIDGVDEIVLVHTGADFSDLPLYIVPRRGRTPDIVLGGTVSTNTIGAPRWFAWDQVPETDKRLKSVAKHIIQRCAGFVPAVGDAEPLTVAAGYRPARRSPEDRLREKLRVELGHIVLGNDAYKLVHNYGHAGGGVTLSWGCAKYVGELVDRAISNSES